jgi:hypothetical protein
LDLPEKKFATVRNMWKVYTRPPSASDFNKEILLYWNTVGWTTKNRVFDHFEENKYNETKKHEHVKID